MTHGWLDRNAENAQRFCEFSQTGEIVEVRNTVVNLCSSGEPPLEPAMGAMAGRQRIALMVAALVAVGGGHIGGTVLVTN